MKYVLFCILLSVAAGCPDDDYVTGDSALPDGVFKNDIFITDSYKNPCSPKAPPSISGKVYAPNGIDPVAGASVGIPLALAKPSKVVRCETCVVAGRYSAHTYAKADGSFKLTSIPNGGTFNVSLQKGHFRRIVKVTIPKCGHVSLTKAQTTLPGKKAQHSQWDSIPNIAVITGAWDKMEKVLDKLGVKEKVVYNGKDWGTGTYSMQALLQNLGRMKAHHLILINCGTKFETMVASPGAVRSNIREYVKAGGRLLVTDFSYDYVEQVFPEFIDFEGSDGTSTTTPEAHNAAEMGSPDLTIQAEIKDSQMKAWLKLPEIKALQASGKVKVVGFMTGWAVQKEVNLKTTAKVWVSGPAIWVGGKGDRPLTASYYFQDTDKKGCGRVIFSSYHTYGSGKELLPQERILEYLMLEIGTCRVVE